MTYIEHSVVRSMRTVNVINTRIRQESVYRGRGKRSIVQAGVGEQTSNYTSLRFFGSEIASCCLVGRDRGSRTVLGSFHQAPLRAAARYGDRGVILASPNSFTASPLYRPKSFNLCSVERTDLD